MNKQQIILVAGGTGGHIFPALRLAEVIDSAKWRVRFVTDRRGLPYFDGHSDVMVSPVTNLLAGSIWRRFGGLIKMTLALFQAVWIILRYRPSIIVGFGGYPTVPMCVMAVILRRNLVVHEQNRVLGRANRIVARFCKRVCLSFPDTRRVPVSTAAVVVTGNPVRLMKGVQVHGRVNQTSKKKLKVLVTGGSLGARFVSDVVAAAMADLESQDRHMLFVTQQSLQDDCDRIRKAYTSLGIDHRVEHFIDNMSEELIDCDLVIGRSGGSTVAELMVAGRPSILFPLPIATDNQQRLNAAYLEDNGAAKVLKQDSESSAKLTELLVSFCRDPKKWQNMGKQAAKLAMPDAAERIKSYLLATVSL